MSDCSTVTGAASCKELITGGPLTCQPADTCLASTQCTQTQYCSADNICLDTGNIVPQYHDADLLYCSCMHYQCWLWRADWHPCLQGSCVRRSEDLSGTGYLYWDMLLARILWFCQYMSHRLVNNCPGNTKLSCVSVSCISTADCLSLPVPMVCKEITSGGTKLCQDSITCNNNCSPLQFCDSTSTCQDSMYNIRLFEIRLQKIVCMLFRSNRFVLSCFV